MIKQALFDSVKPIKVAFLDRDGVINHDAGYVYKVEDFEFIDGVIEALKILQKKGYALIVVTNQSGIGRGYYTEVAYQHLTHTYRDKLVKEGVELLDVFHCPHHPADHCQCRKPEPGLLLQAIEKHNINIQESLMFGDKLSDIQAAAAAGITRAFLITKPGQTLKIDLPIIVNSGASLLSCVSNNNVT